MAFPSLVRRCLLLTGIVSIAVAQPYRPLVFVGGSMSPTYQDGEVAITTTRFSELNHGDIVVLKTDRGRIVKRVAYMEGDGVPQVRILGRWTDGADFELSTYRKRHASYYREVPVPAGCLYVLGDEPVRSIDSRQLGFFRIDQVERVVVGPKARIYPDFVDAQGHFKGL